jgi:hypothetical protein
MRKATVRALTTSDAVAQGVELATIVGATATEALRSRRDPAVVARKRQRAARRRVRGWTAGAVVSGAATAGGVAVIASSGAAVTPVVLIVIFVALLVWSLSNVVRSASELRARNRIVAALPAPSPPRRPVAAQIRPDMARLDGYSDGLRRLVGMIGIVDDDTGVRALRDEILAAADATESRLRRQAADLTGVLRARRGAPKETAAQLDGTAELLRRQITEGVAAYGELVSAASEAASASSTLADRAARPGLAASAPGSRPALAGGAPAPHAELEQPIDQLRALAAGMRELTDG